MGGIGSDSYYRWNKKTTCEEVKRIDVRHLRKLGWWKKAQTGFEKLSWSCGGEPSGSIDFQMTENAMILNYRVRHSSDEDWESVKETVWLERTACNYGCSRAWFSFPHCGRRVRKMAPGLKVDQDEVRAIIEESIIKREIRESDSGQEAQKKVKAFQAKEMRAKKKSKEKQSF